MEQQPLLFLLFLLFLWLGSGPVQSSVIRRWYWYNRRPRTWEEAHKFCRREHDAFLATVRTDSDISGMNMNSYSAWFGLKKTGTDWEWVYGSNVDGMSNVSMSTPAPSQSSGGSGGGGSGGGGSGGGGSGGGDPDWWWKQYVFVQDEPESGEACGKLVYSEVRAHGDECGEKHFVFCQDWTWPFFHFIPETKSWSEGLKFCTDHHLSYMFRLTGASVYTRNFPVWIHSDYRTTAQSPAPDPSSDVCFAVSSQSKSRSEHSCSEAFPVLCYGHNVVLVQELLAWEEALETCRNLTPSSHSSSYRMLRLEPDELQYVLSHAHNATTSKVWVGLRFLGGSWFWSDGGAVSLSSLPVCPESGLHCGALVLNETPGSDPLIEPSDCSQTLNVLCYGEP